MWDIICDSLPNKNIYFETSHKKQVYKETFQAIYAKIKNLFSSQNRSDGTPYFYHLLETAFILIEESWIEDLAPETIFVALLHDIIEDTNNNYDSLWRNIEPKWRELAFGVHLISKPPFHTYIEDEKERSDYISIVAKIEIDNLDLSWNIIDETLVDNSIVEKYNYFRKKYKPIRNQRHFENYRDYETFKKYAKEEAKELGVSFSDTLLDVICRRSINVKLADRLHNLRTLWHMSKKKIDKKIDETEKYLLWIADEVNPAIANKIRAEIQKLQTDSIPKITDWVKTMVCVCMPR